MGYRSFKDSDGIEWQTWDVVPRLDERRLTDRRLQNIQPITIDRRLRIERRVSSGHRPGLIAGLDGGWLCFETSAEKRRLAPIPGDWLSCAKERLQEYCALAKRARRISGPTSVTD